MTTVVGTPPGVTASGYRVTPPPIPTTGLAYWFDADHSPSFTESAGNVVEQWRDRSGSGLTLNPQYPATGGARDTSRNGHKVLRCTGKFVAPYGLLYSAAPPAGIALDNFSAFTVAFTDNTADPDHRVYAGLGPLSLSHFNATSNYGGLIASPGAWVGNTAPIVNVWNLQGVIRTAGSMQFRSNGANIGAPITAAISGAIAVSMGGEIWSDSQMQACSIAEVIFYNRVVTGPELTQIESYLKTKWGTP